MTVTKALAPPAPPLVLFLSDGLVEIVAGTVLTMADQTPEEPAPPAAPVNPIDDVVTTRHELVTATGTLAYTASAGRVVLREEVHEDGVFRGLKAKAEVFVVSYVADTDRGRASSSNVRVQRRPGLLQRVATLRPPRAPAGRNG